MKYCICGEEIEKKINGWDSGNNAEPIRKGRCCDKCNKGLVIPTRLNIKILENDKH